MKKEIKTEAEYQREVRLAEKKPFSEYAIWFGKLRYLRLSLNGENLYKYEVWAMGFRDADKILAGKTDIEFRKA